MGKYNIKRIWTNKQLFTIICEYISNYIIISFMHNIIHSEFLEICAVAKTYDLVELTGQTYSHVDEP